MDRPVDRPVNRPGVALLWVRATVVGALAVFLGVAGHTTADGLLPGATALALLGVAAVLSCVPLLARPASTLRLVGLMVGGQAVIHLVLTLGAGHVGDASRSTVGGSGPGPAGLPEVAGRRIGSLQEAYDVPAHVSSATPALPAHLVSDVTSHAPMMSLHLLAAVLVGLWLAAGERALWRFLAMTGRRLVLAALLLLPPLAPAATGRAPAAAGPVHAPLFLLRSRPLLQRGPPVPTG